MGGQSVGAPCLNFPIGPAPWTPVRAGWAEACPACHACMCLWQGAVYSCSGCATALLLGLVQQCPFLWAHTGGLLVCVSVAMFLGVSLVACVFA